MTRILTVLGARPQFIKASAVSRALKATSGFQEVLVHTGQHFDANMSSVFFEELGLAQPHYYLGIHGGPHGQMTGRMLEKLEQVMLDESPDVVLVYGDTNSTLAGALAAAKLHIPVAHVEAGLRSFNMRMPEEVNRILTDRLSSWLFVPTAAARSHLLAEGSDPTRIENVGDVMYDVALQIGDKASSGGGVLHRLGLVGKPYVLVTAHRAENTDAPERMAAIVDATLALRASIPVVWPLHPRTRDALARSGRLNALTTASGVFMLDPLGYLDMVQLERHAAVIATDSGGVQKEAYFYRVPCVTLRDETEWTELVDAGWNRLVPSFHAQSILSAIIQARSLRGGEVDAYGRGDAALKIAQRLQSDLRSAGKTSSFKS